MEDILSEGLRLQDRFVNSDALSNLDKVARKLLLPASAKQCAKQCAKTSCRKEMTLLPVFLLLHAHILEHV